MPPDPPVTPKLDPATLKALLDEFDKYPIIRREEGDYWVEDPEEPSVIRLRDSVSFVRTADPVAKQSEVSCPPDPSYHLHPRTVRHISSYEVAP